MFQKKKWFYGLWFNIFVVLASFATPQDTGSDAKTSVEAVDPLKEKIANILKKNPEIVVAALQEFSNRQEQERQEKLKASLVAHKKDLLQSSQAILLGNEAAPIKLVVFIDPNCVHCRSFVQSMNRVHPHFPKVAILIRLWPILGENSEEAVKGLWAIKQQGQSYYDQVSEAMALSGDQSYTLTLLQEWAEKNKLDVKKFTEDANSPLAKDAVEFTKTLAKNIGLEGTPSCILVTEKNIQLVMPTDEESLSKILKEASESRVS